MSYTSNDILYEAEQQANYLNRAVMAMDHIVDALTTGLLAWKNGSSDAWTIYVVDWTLEHSNDLFVLLRELERISDDLSAAVTKEFENGRNEQ